MYDDVSVIFGQRVKEERKRLGFSREKLADYAGVSVDLIKRVEQGKGAKLTDAYNIASALSLPLQALLPPQEDITAKIRTIHLLVDDVKQYIFSQKLK